MFRRFIKYILIISAFCLESTAVSLGAVPLVRRVWETKERGKGKVTLTAFIPDAERNSGKAVIICPGGSYFWLDREDEGLRMAECLREKGIAAYLLDYRTAGEFHFIFDSRWLYKGNSYPDMLDDLRQAIRIVRAEASAYGVDKVGVMGFSAGGHLAAMAALSYMDETPDFVAMIYPVVTMSDESCVHKRSRRGLMGVSRAKREMRDSLSVEKHVMGKCCPVFLLSCKDDKVVNCRNSEKMDSALTAHNVPHKYLSLPCGGHGFGYKNAGSGPDAFNWVDAFIDWVAGYSAPPPRAL